MYILQRKNPLRLRFAFTPVISNVLFYFCFFAYATAAILRDTTLRYAYTNLAAFLWNVMWFAAIISLVNVLLFEDFTIGQMMLIAAGAIVLFVSYRHNASPIMFETFAIAVSAKNVRLKKFFNVCTLYYVGILLFVYAIYKMGIIYARPILRGEILRWGFGFIHPNNLGGYLMILGLLVALRNYKKYTVWDYLFLVFLTFVEWEGPQCRTGAFCLVILMGLMFIMQLLDRDVLRVGLFRFGFRFLYPICFSLAFVASYFYNPSNTFLAELDEFLTQRISLGKKYFDKYRFTWVGQKISINTDLGKGELMYLDSAYLRMYIVIGVLGMIVLLVSFVLMMDWCIKKKQYAYLMVLSVMAIYGITELHMDYIHWNVFMVTLGPAIGALGTGKGRNDIHHHTNTKRRKVSARAAR